MWTTNPYLTPLHMLSSTMKLKYCVKIRICGLHYIPAIPSCFVSFFSDPNSPIENFQFLIYPMEWWRCCVWFCFQKHKKIDLCKCFPGPFCWLQYKQYTHHGLTFVFCGPRKVSIFANMIWLPLCFLLIFFVSTVYIQASFTVLC